MESTTLQENIANIKTFLTDTDERIKETASP